MNRRGFTLSEMLCIIAVVGILASLAMIKSVQYRSRALRTTMVSDLKNLISTQEALNTHNHDYAGGTKLRTELPWTAAVTNSGLADAPQTCGVFIGPASSSPNANVFYQGQPGCW